MNRSTPGLPVHRQLSEFTQTHVHRVRDAIQPSHPLSSPSPPALNLSQHQGLFKWVSSLYQVSKYWSFSFNISPSKEHPGLISFRMDWLDLLAVQETLKSLLQHHSSKASILWHPAFFIVQLSHPYMTTGKTIALTIWTFACKVMSLLFNTLSRSHSFPSKEQASFNFMAAVTIHSDFGDQENKVCHCFHCFPIYLPWSDEWILNSWMLNFMSVFSLSSLTFIKRLFNSSSLMAIRVVYLHIRGYWYFPWQSWFQLVLTIIQKLLSVEYLQNYHLIFNCYQLIKAQYIKQTSHSSTVRHWGCFSLYK